MFTSIVLLAAVIVIAALNRSNLRAASGKTPHPGYALLLCVFSLIVSISAVVLLWML